MQAIEENDFMKNYDKIDVLVDGKFAAVIVWLPYALGDITRAIAERQKINLYTRRTNNEFDVTPPLRWINLQETKEAVAKTIGEILGLSFDEVIKRLRFNYSKKEARK